MRSLLVVCLFALAFTTVNAQYTANVYVQDSNHLGRAGFFGNDFVGVKLDGSGYATVLFGAGDSAYGDYVAATNLGGNPMQSGTFDGTVPTSYSVTFTSTGTYWIYLAAHGTTSNVDYIQIRVVANSFSGTISKLYTNPPAGWWMGFPPPAAWLTASAAAEYEAAHPAPSRSPVSSNVSVWLAPLLVAVVMAALMVPVAMIAYKKGKAAAAAAVSGATQMDKEQQQIQLQHVQVHNSVSV